MKLQSLFVCLILATTLATSQAEGQSFFLQDAPGDGACGAMPRAAGGTGFEDSSQASCTAYCTTTGGSVTKNCSGSCTAVDQNCAIGQRGYVQCSDGSKTQCASCPPVNNTCHIGRMCPNGSYISCSSPSGDCWWDGSACFIQCDGVQYWCPGEHMFLC